MTRRTDGGPAYPIRATDTHHTWPGMSLRDAAALAALQGFCANPNVMSDIGYEHHLVVRAFAVADAFLDARRAGGQA